MVWPYIARVPFPQRLQHEACRQRKWAARHVTCWHQEPSTCQILALPPAESAYHGGYDLHGLLRTGPACWQVKQGTPVNVTAVPQALCKKNHKQGNNTCVHTARRTVSSKEAGTGTSVSCILPCLFSVFQHTANTGTLRADGKGGPSYVWVPRVLLCGTQHAHAGEAVATSLPPQIRTLSRSLTSATTAKHRLPDQLASSLQWS